MASNFYYSFIALLGSRLLSLHSCNRTPARHRFFISTLYVCSYSAFVFAYRIATLFISQLFIEKTLKIYFNMEWRADSTL